MFGMATLRGLAYGAICLAQLVAGFKTGDFRTSLSLRDFKEQVSDNPLKILYPTH